MYEITASSIPTSGVNVTVKFYSPLTKSTKLVNITLQGSYDGPTPLHSCPLPATTQPGTSFSVRNLIYRIIGDSGLLIILYTLIIATVIVLLALYHLYAKPKQPPVVIHSPYVHPNTPYIHGHSPPPYQASPPYHHSPVMVNSPSPYRQNKNTPTRLFSVSQ